MRKTYPSIATLITEAGMFTHRKQKSNYSGPEYSPVRLPLKTPMDINKPDAVILPTWGKHPLTYTVCIR